MKLSIIIVSYNTQNLIENCLTSVFKHLPQKTEVIVVDNNSQDDSIKVIQKNFPLVNIIQNQKNLGFAKANNQGIRRSKGEHILLLNSDTIVTKNALQNLTVYLDNHQAVGIVSATLLNSDKSIQPAGGFLPNLLNLFAWFFFIDDLPFLSWLIQPYQITKTSFFSKTRNLGWISGAAMMIRKKTLDQIGLLDENIFMYSEDTDLCWRAKKAGWGVYSLASAQVIHFKQGSGSSKNAFIGEIKGLAYLVQKHLPKWQYPLFRLIIRIGSVLRTFVFGTILRNHEKKQIYQQIFDLV